MNHLQATVRNKTNTWDKFESDKGVDNEFRLEMYSEMEQVIYAGIQHQTPTIVKGHETCQVLKENEISVSD